MFESGLNLDEIDREYEKKVEDFAKKLLEDVEAKSKRFGITVNQIADVMGVRK